MLEIDVGSIVPSTRDLLQVLATRRRNLALLGLVGADRPAIEAARLADLNVSAFAGVDPGPALALAAGATKTVPTLSLALVTDRDQVLAARRHGADGVCIDALLEGWDRLAPTARSMRMLPLAVATDAAGVERGAKLGAKALLLRAASAEAIIALAAAAPRGVTLVALVDGGDAAAIRALAGKVDAAVVPAEVHAAPSFADLVAEVDP